MPWWPSTKAYHGRTNLTMALTAKNMPHKQGFGPFAGEVYRMPMAYPYRWTGAAETIVEDAFEACAGAVHAQIGEQNLAAGTYGNVLRFLPPLVIGDDLLHEALDVLDDAFAVNA